MIHLGVRGPAKEGAKMDKVRAMGLYELAIQKAHDCDAIFYIAIAKGVKMKAIRALDEAQ